jgi:hypothetical protein
MFQAVYRSEILGGIWYIGLSNNVRMLSLHSLSGIAFL